MIARTKMSSIGETGADLHLERMDGPVQAAAVYRLRHQAYSAVGALPVEHAAADQFPDRYDSCPNVQSYGIFQRSGQTLLGSIRANLWNPELGTPEICAFERYKDEISVELGLDSTLVESNRLVTHEIGREESPGLQMALFRAIGVNAYAHYVDYIIIAVRQRHAKLYERMLQFRTISKPKPYPGLNVEMVLMASDFRSLYPWVTRNRPVFTVSTEEANRLALRLPGQTQLDGIESSVALSF